MVSTLSILLEWSATRSSSSVPSAIQIVRSGVVGDDYGEVGAFAPGPVLSGVLVR